MAATETKTAGFLTLRVSRDLIDWYADRAHANGTSRSDEIRAALEQYRDKTA